jgi:hypothetical protein
MTFLKEMKGKNVPINFSTVSRYKNRRREENIDFSEWWGEIFNLTNEIKRLQKLGNYVSA